MNEAACTIGIDVSKRKLDIALLRQGNIKAKVVANTSAGHSQLQQWLLGHGHP